MRVLLANEGIDDPGGVDTYLRAIAEGLTRRGEALAFLHYNRNHAGARMVAQPAFGVLDRGLNAAMADVSAWQPDIVFAHNMRHLDVEIALLRRWPVVKMMHGYFGTCISGQKAHLFPSRQPCGKRFDAACLAYYFPRRCGQADPISVVRRYRWARQQRGLFGAYSAIVVASEHMGQEYVRNGAAPERVHTLPLFAPSGAPPSQRANRRTGDRVLFLGRMTSLKGGDLLIRAVAQASRALGRRLELTLAGDGPSRRAWEALAASEGVDAEFTGWLDSSARAVLLDRAAVLAVPSVWPEPFGLVGLEAAAAGVPAIGFDVGGIREWLHDDENGVLVKGTPAAEALGGALVRVFSDERVRERLGAGALATASRMTLERHLDALVHSVLEPVRDRVVTS